MTVIRTPRPPAFNRNQEGHRRQIRDYCVDIGELIDSGQVGVREGSPYVLKDDAGASASTPSEGQWTKNTAATEVKFHTTDADGLDISGSLALVAAGNRIVIENSDIGKLELYTVVSNDGIASNVATYTVTQEAVGTDFALDEEGRLTASAIGASDASTVTYTQNDPSDWNQASPTVVSTSLDELASRVTTNEGDISTNQGNISSNEGRITTLENFRLENTGLSQALDQVVVFQGSDNTPVKSAGFAVKSGVQDPVFAPVTGEPGDVYVLRSGVNSALYQNRGATAGSVWANIGVAPNISYTPSESTDWLSPPSEVQEALDGLAQRSTQSLISLTFVNADNVTPYGATGGGVWDRANFDSAAEEDDLNLWDGTNQRMDFTGLPTAPTGWGYEADFMFQGRLGNNTNNDVAAGLGLGTNGNDPENTSAFGNWLWEGTAGPANRYPFITNTVAATRVPVGPGATANTVEFWFFGGDLDYEAGLSCWVQVVLYLAQNDVTVSY